ncbi:PPP family 3-phenylpropionic acid transporter [Rheinheimera pacifica]|uniref:MFS transporter n=1 Tax=Rheinheimera pacifica TaxID=173990 RepID=UPI002860C199|nr:MFS transporter [Rheinheimera pacifica]MDR6983656.1 PPP family 3-phenylpropionic acid transporter [Rheinheimera pacifica]
MFSISARPALVLAYFTYFGVLGIFVPYFGLFLDGRGLSSADIGLLLAIVTASRIVGPTVWALIAERSGKPLTVMRLGALLAAIGWLSSFADYGFWPLLLGFALFSFFWTAILPQLEVATFAFVNDDTRAYSRIRTAGSVGYIVLVMLGGWLFERYGSEFLPLSALLFLVLLLTSLFLLPKVSVNAELSSEPVRFSKLIKNSVLLRFMLAALLLQMSFAPFYGFFTLYSRDLGYSGTQTGLFIGLAVAAEIAAFYFAGNLMRNRSYRVLLSVCYGLTVLRWSLLATMADNVWLLCFSMLLHAGSFAIAHSCAMQFIQQFFPKKLRSRGQALYAGVIFGGGGVIGAYFSGLIWQNGKGASLAFMIAAMLALAATLLALTLPGSKAAAKLQ